MLGLKFIHVNESGPRCPSTSMRHDSSKFSLAINDFKYIFIDQITLFNMAHKISQNIMACHVKSQSAKPIWAAELAWPGTLCLMSVMLETQLVEWIVG